MRVPLSWLKDYVEITLPIEELAHRLTMAGIEVAAIERIGLPAPTKAPSPHHTWRAEEGGKRPHLAWDRDKIVIGEIVEIKPHPNADRLVLAVVDYGAEEYETVVTGAPNLFPYLGVERPGLKVAFALEGARLYDGHAAGWEVMVLKRAKIRGVPSRGMVCSEKELGISENHETIIILDDDAPVGMPLADYMGDAVLELDLTPNLGRCLSILGVAREVAALTGQRLSVSASQRLRYDAATLRRHDACPFVEIEIADPDLCSRYSAALVRGVKVGPSPSWMQRRLTLAGLRPINNIVDVTNYVMLELGQPLHAFDYDKLAKGKGQGAKGVPTIIVRRAQPGETITTLDGIERELTEGMLLITDPSGPIAIAGVMGGLETEVSEETTNVLIEGANFNNINIRRTSQALKLRSEASLRFERGLDPELTVPALVRASELMRQLAGGTIAEGIADAYPIKPEKKVIELTADEVERILGIEIPTEEIVRILRALEFEVNEERVTSNEDVPVTRLLVTVPSYRLDVSIPADLIEEIARVYSYDRIPATLLRDTLPKQRMNWALRGEERVRDILVGCGLTEVINYSLTSLESIGKLTPDGGQVDESQYLKLANPLTSEREYMRRSLMPGLLETLRSNLRHTDRVAIFEIGRVYLSQGEEELPEEPRRLGIAMSGPRLPRSWLSGDRDEMNFFDLKGIVETLLRRLGITDYAFTPTTHPTFHPGRVAELRLPAVGHQPLAILGEVHPLVRENFDLPPQRVCLMELDLEMLLEAVPSERYYQPISKFPAVIQDIALIVDEDVPAKQVHDLILQAGGKLLTDAVLFDLYRGEPIPPGKKSLAYSLTFQAHDRTLTEEEVKRIRERIRRQLKREIGAELRAQ